jgi:hypothetical protein
LLDEIQFQKSAKGTCVEILHLGKFNDEPASFTEMEAFAEQERLSRLSKVHREIYLSDFRKIAPEKLRTV